MFEGLSVFSRVRNLALQGMNASSGPEAREALAVEIEGLREHMIGVANTKHLGRPLFGGTTGTDQAFDPNGTYIVDDGAIESTVMTGLTVQVTVTGEQVFGTTGSIVLDTLTHIVAPRRATV